MSERESNKPEKWEVAEMVRVAIDAHETKKEGSFITKTEFEYANKLRDQLVDGRLKTLEEDASDAKDRNKWLFRLVIGAIIASLIPIAIALLSQAQGNILR